MPSRRSTYGLRTRSPAASHWYCFYPQEKFLEIDNAYKAERIAIEKKYFAQKAEIWKKRAEIISGGGEVEAKVPLEEGDGEPLTIITVYSV